MTHTAEGSDSANSIEPWFSDTSLAIDARCRISSGATSEKTGTFCRQGRTGFAGTDFSYGLQKPLEERAFHRGALL